MRKSKGGEKDERDAAVELFLIAEMGGWCESHGGWGECYNCLPNEALKIVKMFVLLQIYGVRCLPSQN